MRIAVCDDEDIFLNEICYEIDEFYKSLDIDCIPFSDGSEIVSAYEKGQCFDAIFLDVEMKQLDGMKTAEKIRSYSKDVPIIFLTSHTELAMDGYEVGAFRFLKKPVDSLKFQQTLKDIQNIYKKKKSIRLKENGNEYFLSPDEIISAESEDNMVNFVTAQREYKVRMKLTEAMKLFAEAETCFCRIHRCSIIHLGHVASCSEKEVRLDNGKVLPISKSYSSEFKRNLFEYVKYNAR